MKKSFLSLLAVVAMVGCTQNDMDLKGSSEDQVPILVGANALSIESGVSTRTPFDGPISAKDSLEAKVLLATITGSATNGDYSLANTSLVNSLINFKDIKTNTATFGFKTPQYYPVNPAAVVALVGLYPQSADFKPSVAIPAGAATTYDVTVKGNEDLMIAQEVKTKKSDIVTTGTKVYPALDFMHLLTRLDIKVVAKDSSSYRSWGKIKEISVMKAGNTTLENVLSVTLTPAVNPIAMYSGTADSIACYVIGTKKNEAQVIVKNYTDTVLNAAKYIKMIKLPVAASAATLATDAKEAAYSMIAPFDASDISKQNVTLKIVTEKSATTGYIIAPTLTLSSGIGSKISMRGKKIVITLTFVGREIVAKASVVDWVDGGNADGTVE